MLLLINIRVFYKKGDFNMKSKCLLFLITLFTVTAFSTIKSELCFCAYKCGPRDYIEGQDSPRQVYIEELDRNVCFCADRDVKRYRRGKCVPTFEDAEEIDNFSACS